MMVLVDTNVFLEVLLRQDKKDMCKSFLNEHASDLYMSDFTLHSIGVILHRHGKLDVFRKFLRGILPQVVVLGLAPDRIEHLLDIIEEKGLDFDDSYQYYLARDHGLGLVTMDRDFEKVDDIEVTFI